LAQISQSNSARLLFSAYLSHKNQKIPEWDFRLEKGGFGTIFGLFLSWEAYAVRVGF